MSTAPHCKNLVLDAGPLLSLSPLRGLAATYLTVPQVLDELKDSRAREHFERLGLSAGVKIEVRSPDSASLSHVIQFAKKTGDYSVLSHADLSVLALTYDLHVKAKAELEKQAEETASSVTAQPPLSAAGPTKEDIQTISDELGSVSLDKQPQESDNLGGEETADTNDIELTAESYPEEETAPDDSEDQEREPLDVELVPSSASNPGGIAPSSRASEIPLYDDPSDEDDGDGEWITPANVSLHKSRALDLLPSADASRKGKGKKDNVIAAGCMTADFAMQNVLLQMGLSLVGVEGTRIQKLKTWVLRCHACFKICKDNSKKFCPSCGNPTLLRASVTIASPDAAADAPTMQIHLKKNFQYKTRGTKYSIPAPKPGSAKHGPGEGLILREDQNEYMRAKRLADGKKQREEQKMVKGVMAKGGEGGISVGSWMDPDWVPEIMSASAGGKGRTVKTGGRDGDMPVIGYGRKNPNEKKRRK